MSKKMLKMLLCGVMVLGLATGCGNEKNKDNINENLNNTQENKKVETLKVGNYKLKYGYYKSDKNRVHIKQDGTIWMQNGISYNYSVEDNYLVFKNGDMVIKYRVESDDYVIVEISGEDTDTMYYYETPED